LYVIYALVDPDEIYRVCYIGMSSDVYSRFTQHLRDTDNGSLKGQWLKELRDRNRVPYCKVLEDVPTEEEARIREAYWVQFYLKLHMPLTNSSIPQVLTPKTRYSRTPPEKASIAYAKTLHSQGMGYKRIALTTGLTEYAVRQLFIDDEEETA
jgi:hypothetical protein